ncbi:hypothetical protein AOLI_G00008060 [Acnodon oligacanthus]
MRKPHDSELQFSLPGAPTPVRFRILPLGAIRLHRPGVPQTRRVPLFPPPPTQSCAPAKAGGISPAQPLTLSSPFIFSHLYSYKPRPRWPSTVQSPALRFSLTRTLPIGLASYQPIVGRKGGASLKTGGEKNNSLRAVPA